ncbi:MAG: restriction endonuclease subunit S [Victivallales bacterium]|nr:restriction endonuclease subunit S [Victivallales bacterium]
MYFESKGLQKSSAKLISANSIILSTRAPIGHLAINKSEMATNQGCRGVIPSKAILVSFSLRVSSFNTKSGGKEMQTSKSKAVPTNCLGLLDKYMSGFHSMLLAQGSCNFTCKVENDF